MIALARSARAVRISPGLLSPPRLAGAAPVYQQPPGFPWGFGTVLRSEARGEPCEILPWDESVCGAPGAIRLS